MRRALTALIGAAALAAPVANAATIAKKKPVKAKKRIVTIKKKITGVQGSADRWGVVQVTIIVKKTTTIVGKHKTVKRKIVGMAVPIYPDHTDRSVFINQQALPLLRQEVLQEN